MRFYIKQKKSVLPFIDKFMPNDLDAILHCTKWLCNFFLSTFIIRIVLENRVHKTFIALPKSVSLIQLSIAVDLT